MIGLGSQILVVTLVVACLSHVDWVCLPFRSVDEDQLAPAAV